MSVVIILLTFILYGAQWFHCRNASMSLLLFFNTYLVGRYIRLYPIPFIWRYKLYIFFISLILLVCEPILLHAFRMDAYLKYITGNLNILILLVDVTLLLLCNSKIKEGKGNFLTKNILAVYLIHESGVGRKILHDYIPYPAYFDVLYVLGIVVSVVFICTLIEEIRRKLMDKVEYSLVVGLRKYLRLDF